MTTLDDLRALLVGNVVFAVEEDGNSYRIICEDGAVLRIPADWLQLMPASGKAEQTGRKVGGSGKGAG